MLKDEPLDKLARPLRDLRVSVTDRCNFRCPYCMPAEIYGERYEFLPRNDLLTFEEITRIVGVVEKGEDQEVFQHPFKVGDAIRVVDGPFMDFSGFIQEINNEKQKLKVSVSIFGRPTPVELDYLQVEIEK